MSAIFVDTAAWLALLNSRDQYHEEANQVMAALRQQNAPLVTSAFVLLEVADALAAPVYRLRIVQFIDSLRQATFVTVIPVSQQSLDEAWKLYSNRQDKAWGLTDCSSFVIMAQEHITTAFTSDQHFVQAGFQKLLG